MYDVIDVSVKGLLVNQIIFDKTTSNTPRIKVTNLCLIGTFFVSMTQILFHRIVFSSRSCNFFSLFTDFCC